MKSVQIITLVLSLISLVACEQKLADNEAITLNNQGLEVFNAGDLNAAMNLFKKAIKIPQLSAETKALIYRNIAQTFIAEEQIDSSIHYSTLAAKCYKENSYEYLVNMADIELMTDRTADALVKLKKAYALEPNKIEVNNVLGLIYLGEYGAKFMDLKKALAYNEKAFEVNRDRMTQEVLARNYFELEDYTQAEFHYEQLHSNYKEMVINTLYLGMVKYNQGKKAESESLFDEVLEADSTWAETIAEFKGEYE